MKSSKKQKAIWRSVFITVSSLKNGGLERMRWKISRRARSLLRQKESLGKKYRRIKQAEKDLERMRNEHETFLRAIVTKVQYIEPEEIQNRNRELNMTISEIEMDLGKPGPEF